MIAAAVAGVMVVLSVFVALVQLDKTVERTRAGVTPPPVRWIVAGKVAAPRHREG